MSKKIGMGVSKETPFNFDEMSKEVATLKAELEKSNLEVATLKSELEKSNLEVATLKSELEAVNKKQGGK